MASRDCHLIALPMKWSLTNLESGTNSGESNAPSEMENISRGLPGGFCHYPHRGVDARQHGCKTAEYGTKVQTPSSPCIKCNVLRESLSEDSQNIPWETLKRRGSWLVGNLYISLITDSGKNIGWGKFLLVKQMELVKIKSPQASNG